MSKVADELRIPDSMLVTDVRGEEEIPFTVASALLRELGERLVGKPHIALAELIKNSYDADATDVIVRFDSDEIAVVDNGHGMTNDEFRNFWMRIGSPHKQEQPVSRLFKRPVTGSKGVGRLAVQFLANKVEMRTVSQLSQNNEIVARINWDEAVAAGELVEAKARLSRTTPEEKFANGSQYGTAITLRGLNRAWGEEEFRDLAREIWSLQPPFRSNPDLPSDRAGDFSVKLETPSREDADKFNEQMDAALNQWEARIVGRLVRKSGSGKSKNSEPTVEIVVEFDDRRRYPYEYIPPSELVSQAEFEIRVFRLNNRLKQGIRVQEAREYFTKHGGVHIYDAGFHLPYYGPGIDWLEIERDHARRLTHSKLLPDKLQESVNRGLNFLPSQRRLFGVVHINTNREYEEAIRRQMPRQDGSDNHLNKTQKAEIRRRAERQTPYLKVEVTRDRLVDNEAFDTLGKIVRTALDYYSIKAQERNQEEIKKKGKDDEPPPKKIRRVEQVLGSYRSRIPGVVFNDLKKHLKEAVRASETEAEKTAHQASLLGSLATAGMSALAFDHELSKQISLLEGVADEIASIEVSDASIRKRLSELSDRVREWVQRARATRALFSYLTTEENRSTRTRFKARSLVKEVERQTRILLRGIPLKVEQLDESLRLPDGTFAEWSAILQNLFINSVNAMLDSEDRVISVSSEIRGQTRVILVQDTGCGVDLETAEELFKPFERRLKLSPERQNLGLGGTGLGLTIIRLIADNLGCEVGFVEPRNGFSTALQISWKEK